MLPGCFESPSFREESSVVDDGGGDGEHVTHIGDTGVGNDRFGLDRIWSRIGLQRVPLHLGVEPRAKR